MALQSTSAEQNERELVTFHLAEQEFGLNIMNVQEIVRMPEITKIPKAPFYVEGIANLRGNVLPVISTRHRFSMEEVGVTDQTRVVVVDVNGKNIGLVVDSVSEVMRIEENKIEPPPKVVSGDVDTEFLDGVLKINDGERLVMALNPNRVCEIEIEAETKTSTQTSTARQEIIKKETLDEDQLVTFSLLGEEYAIDIQSVREIIRIPELIKVPQAPEYVEGLISLRNRLLPLIDLRNLFRQILMIDEQTDMVNNILSKKEEAEKWWTDLKLSVEKLNNEQKNNENQYAQISKFPLTGWIESLKTKRELVTAELEKITKMVVNIEKAREDINKLAFAEAVQFSEDVMLPLINRLNETIDKCIKVVQSSEDQRVLVTEINNLQVGLVVDSVNEVKRIEKHLIDPPPSLVNDQERKQVKGVAKLDEGKRLIMILDNNNLLDIEAIGDLMEEHGEGFVEQEETETNSMKKQSLEEEQLVSFRLGKEEFGIRIMQIQEINRLTEITKVPRVPNFVAGVTNLRGSVVPVINLRTRFEMEQKEVDDRTRIIIVDLDGKRTGLIVDQVNEVLRILKSNIEPSPEVVSSDKKNEFIDGIGKLDEGKRMMVLLDVERILSSTEKEQLAQVGDNSEGGSDTKPKTPVKRNTRKVLKKAEE